MFIRLRLFVFSVQWHAGGGRLRWTPWDNCSYPAILDYPDAGFPNGPPTIVLAALTLLVNCILLARICDFYFLPAVKTVATRWQLKGDVVNAVVFASAASWPELAISVITVFDTEQAGVGIGTIVGTSVFNTLAVPALCSFCFSKGSPVDPVTTTRDTAMSAISLLLLGLVLKDNTVGWTSASLMLLLYLVYILGLSSFSNLMQVHQEPDQYEKNCLLKGATKFYVVQPDFIMPDDASVMGNGTPLRPSNGGGVPIGMEELSLNGSTIPPSADHGRAFSNDCGLIRVMKSCLKGLVNVFLWPFHNLLRLIMPPHERYPYLVIFLGLIYIALITFVVAWMITILGYKLGIPNSLLSLTVLAVGLGYPDIISSLKVAKEGTASAALSNALGANTFNILICLGLPWFIKAVTVPDEGGVLFLNLEGVTYSINIMFTALLMFYAALIANRFIFNAKVGFICIAIYIFFVVTMSLLELNVFFPANKPLCNIKDYYNDPFS